MIGKIYRMQAYVTWVLYAVLILLMLLPGGFMPGLHRSELMYILIQAGAWRLVLPIGTVLAVIAKVRKEIVSGDLWRIQIITFLLSIPMPLVLLILWVGYSGI
ncbi:MAG: hypothetical protein IKL25_11695 [Clostridia bacterium]|nr:hypothetical protein [Clostridia bacterium]